MKKNMIDELGVSAFFESMGMMLQSGIQTDEAVSLLVQQNKNDDALSLALVVMKEKTEAGESLSAAMKAAGTFPDYAVSMIEAADDTGRTERVCMSLSRYYAGLKRIRTKLRSLIVYPTAMLTLLAAVLVVMITAVLPVLSNVYKSMTALSGTSFHYIRLAYGICWAVLVLALLLLCAILVVSRLYNSNKRNALMKFGCRFGFVRKIVEDMALIRFSAALELYVASGEMQDSAVRNSIPAADCAHIEEKLKKILEHMENEGRSFANASFEEELLEPVYSRMLLAGERGGQLEEILSRLQQLLEDDLNAGVERAVSAVDSLLSGILILAVGFSLISVMLPLIGIMNSIG